MNIPPELRKRLLEASTKADALSKEVQRIAIEVKRTSPAAAVRVDEQSRKLDIISRHLIP